MKFEPTIAQALFGQPHQQYGCHRLVTAALEEISDELDRVMWNLHQKEYVSPFRNTGAAFKELKEFQVEAYSWDEEYEQPWNFKCGEVEISWYKYLGRGMSSNTKISPTMVASILDQCITAICEYERAHDAPAS